MPASNVIPKIVAGVLLLLVPGALGWWRGRGGEGNRLVRVCAGLALLAAVAGVVVAVIGAVSPTGNVSAPGNDFASAGRVLYFVLGGGLLAIAVLLATFVCGVALAQSRVRGRLGRFKALAYTVAVPLFLSVAFFVADLLHAPSSQTHLLLSASCGTVATLSLAAHVLCGLGRGERVEAPRAR